MLGKPTGLRIDAFFYQDLKGDSRRLGCARGEGLRRLTKPLDGFRRIQILVDERRWGFALHETKIPPEVSQP